MSGRYGLIYVAGRFAKAIAAAAISIMVMAGAGLAQEATVLVVEGWSRQTSSDGVVAYRCASAICARGSVVSYKSQPHRPGLTLAEFEAHHRGLAQRNAGSGRILAVRIMDPRTRTIDDVRVLQISREVDWDDGTTTFSIEARIIGADRSFSLVSDSLKREWTANNCEGFLRLLVDLAGIRG